MIRDHDADRLTNAEAIIDNQDRLIAELIKEKAEANGGDYIGTLLDTVRRATGARDGVGER